MWWLLVFLHCYGLLCPYIPTTLDLSHYTLNRCLLVTLSRNSPHQGVGLLDQFFASLACCYVLDRINLWYIWNLNNVWARWEYGKGRNSWYFKKDYLRIAENPIKAFLNSAKDFFYRDKSQFCLKEDLGEYIKNPEFITQFKDIIDYRTRRFYKERLEVRKINMITKYSLDKCYGVFCLFNRVE